MDAVRAVAFSPKLRQANADEALRLFSHNFDIKRWTDERPLDGSPPIPWVQSYVSTDGLRRVAQVMRRKATEVPHVSQA